MSHDSYTTDKPHGLTLVEAMISTVIFVTAALTVYHGMTHGYFVSKKSRAEAEGVLRVARQLEDIQLTAYNLISTNLYPIEYVTDSDGLVYAMTTNVERTFYPYEHKKISIDYTWRLQNGHKHTKYFYIKAP